MKTALAIVCSLILVWTQNALALNPAVSDAAAMSCCGCESDCALSCCPAQPLPESQPVSAAPVSSPTHLVSLSPALPAWILPPAAASQVPTFLSRVLKADNAPLYERDCVRLI